jgi:hypothetical protein
MPKITIDTDSGGTTTSIAHDLGSRIFDATDADVNPNLVGPLSLLDAEFIVCFTAFFIMFAILYHKLRPQHINPWSVVLPHDEWKLEYSSKIIECIQAIAAAIAIGLFELYVVSWHYVHVTRILIDAFFVADVVLWWILWWQQSRASPLFRRLIPNENRMMRKWMRLPEKSAQEVARLNDVQPLNSPWSDGVWITFHHTVTSVGNHGFLALTPNALLRRYMLGEIPIAIMHLGWLHDHSRVRPDNIDEPAHGGGGGELPLPGATRLLPPSRMARVLARADRHAERMPEWIHAWWRSWRAATSKELRLARFKIVAVTYLVCRMVSFSEFALRYWTDFRWDEHPVLVWTMAFCLVFVLIMNWIDCVKLFRVPFPEAHARMKAFNQATIAHLGSFARGCVARVRQFEPPPHNTQQPTSAAAAPSGLGVV